MILLGDNNEIYWEWILWTKIMLTKDIKKEIIAFANTNGGKIYIGVNDDGNIIGIDNPDNDLQALTGMINEGIKPSLIEYTKIKIE